MARRPLAPQSWLLCHQRYISDPARVRRDIISSRNIPVALRLSTLTRRALHWVDLSPLKTRTAAVELIILTPVKPFSAIHLVTVKGSVSRVLKRELGKAITLSSTKWGQNIKTASLCGHGTSRLIKTSF